jgi:hypothetical protein
MHVKTKQTLSILFLLCQQNSTCKDKIVGYEQHAMYSSPEEFRLALSLCDSK